jgi:hypothetical protein
MSPVSGFIRIHVEYEFGELQEELAVYGTLRKSTHTKAGQSWCGPEFVLADELNSFGSKAT